MKNKNVAPNIIAASWGFAEATVFFIVPDVFITYRALHGYKAAFIACAYTLAGALVGGTLMYLWAVHSANALHFVQHVPAVTAQMATAAHADYADHGVFALLIAPLRGIPYKLYSVIAPSYGVGFWSFLAVSVFARLSRFVVVAIITATISNALKRPLSFRQRLGILIGVWIVFYALYFYRLG